MTTRLPFLLLLGSLGACASIQPVPYAPQPGRIRDPRAEISAFIKTNTTSGCIAEPEFKDALLDVKFVCSYGGVGHQLARVDRVDRVSLEQYQEWYRVVLHHSNGTDDFTWSSKSLEDVQRAADAFEALLKPPAAGEAQKNAI